MTTSKSLFAKDDGFRSGSGAICKVSRDHYGRQRISWGLFFAGLGRLLHHPLVTVPTVWGEKCIIFVIAGVFPGKCCVNPPDENRLENDSHGLPWLRKSTRYTAAHNPKCITICLHVCVCAHVRVCVFVCDVSKPTLRKKMGLQLAVYFTLRRLTVPLFVRLVFAS